MRTPIPALPVITLGCAAGAVPSPEGAIVRGFRTAAVTLRHHLPVDQTAGRPPASTGGGGQPTPGPATERPAARGLPLPRAGAAVALPRRAGPGRAQGGLTWSAPGWSPDSPRERCWPSGPCAGVWPACSGTPTGTQPWPRPVTVSVFSSSSRGGFCEESGFRQRHSRLWRTGLSVSQGTAGGFGCARQ